MRNILVFGHSNIGDVCYDLVVIPALRRNYPQAKVSFLTSSRCRDIVAGHCGIDRVITFDRNGKDNGIFSRLRFVRGLRRERFDLAVVLKNSRTYQLLGIPAVWRVDNQARLRDKHPVDRYLNVLRAQGLAVEGAVFDFSVTKEDSRFCDDFLQAKGVSGQDILVGVLPLAAWSLKSWPLEKWNTLAEELDRLKVKVINLGKMPDNDLGRRLGKEISPNIISGKTILAQAMALLRRCRLFIGPDSSLLHLASCMGVETIGLYGATSCEHFYPYFHRRNIIRPKTELPCMPCYPGPGPSCRKDNPGIDFGPCMEAIKVEDVLRLVRERLDLS